MCIRDRGEVKWFYLDFESIGAGTCVFMDFQDGVQVAFGDEAYCNEWSPNVEFVPGVDMVVPITMTHTYQ